MEERSLLLPLLLLLACSTDFFFILALEIHTQMRTDISLDSPLFPPPPPPPPPTREVNERIGQNLAPQKERGGEVEGVGRRWRNDDKRLVAAFGNKTEGASETCA